MEHLKKGKTQVTENTTEPTVVAEFKIIPPTHPRDQFIEDYTYCCLCGSELIFTHVTNFIQGEVKEEAHCSSCNIRAKQNIHRLQ